MSPPRGTDQPVEERWIRHPEQISWRHRALVVQLWDHLTDGPPVGGPRLLLEREGPEGQWSPIQKQPVLTPSGLLAWFELEHRRSAAGLPPVPYRLSVRSALYVPAFRELRDHELTQLQPYDSQDTPAAPPTAPLRLVLYPAPAYPFPPHIPVLRGSVLDADEAPVPDARVSKGNRERTLTDATGQFALPLRWARPGPATLEVRDRSGRTASLTVTLPQALTSAVHITLR